MAIVFLELLFSPELEVAHVVGGQLHPDLDDRVLLVLPDYDSLPIETSSFISSGLECKKAIVMNFYNSTDCTTSSVRTKVVGSTNLDLPLTKPKIALHNH